MALLKFLKGNYTNLSTKAISEGQILICGDTGEMFVDVAADKRVKIGDFSVVANITALEALDASAVPTSRLYYVEDGNILARSNGTSWIQINKQKTLAELGGVSLDVYNTKMTALDKADTDNANAIAGVDTRLQAAEKKLESVATTEGLDELAETVAGHTTAIDTINGDVNTAGSMLKIANDAANAKDAAIKEAKDAADAAQADVDELVQTHATDKEALEGAIALKANAADVYTKDDVDGKVDTINEAIGTKANTADVYTKDDIDGMVSDLEDADAAINELIGDVEPGKTVVDMIADAQSAATYDDTEVRGLIDTNKDAIEQEVSDRGNAISGLKTELEGKIADVETSVATEKSRAEGIEEGLRTDVDAIKADYLKAADKEDLQAQINTIMNNPDTEGVINSINEFTQYIADHGEIAEGFRADIDANAKAIEDHETLAAQTYETKEDATAKFDEVKELVNTKAVQADWNQNDPAAADFIKNRPFYDGSSLVELLPITTVTSTTASYPYAGYGLVRLTSNDFTRDVNNGDHNYLVNVDGVEYHFSGFNGFMECGDAILSGETTIRPEYFDTAPLYLKSSYNDMAGMRQYEVVFKNPNETHDISIYEISSELKQLDEKFIPDTIARVSEVDAVAGRMTTAEGNITNLQTAIDNLGALAAKDVVSESDLDAELTTKVNAYADVQSALDTHINRTDIHVTTEDKAKWDGAQAAAEATAAANLATARTEITSEIATAKSGAISDAEGKIATAKSELQGEIATAKSEAIADAEGKVSAAKTELQGKIDTVSGALDTYKTENNAAVATKANAADVYNKAEVEAMLTWGDF